MVLQQQITLHYPDKCAEINKKKSCKIQVDDAVVSDICEKMRRRTGVNGATSTVSCWTKKDDDQPLS